MTRVEDPSWLVPLGQGPHVTWARFTDGVQTAAEIVEQAAKTPIGERRLETAA